LLSRRGETPIQTVLLHLQQELVPPSQRTDNAVPPALERLVLACLEKRPEARPQTAGALMAALDRLALAAD
jgi:serine/threonine-protein kinase